MRTLLEKEIRLLLPAFVGAMALAILPVWLVPYNHWNPAYDFWNFGLFPTYFFLFGIVMLGISSYGREIGLKTLPFILAQPLERARIWWTKVAVLVLFVALAFEAWWLSRNLCSLHRPARLVAPEALALSGLTVAVLTAGGLWMTLLLRQTVAAFWLTLFIPMGMISAIEFIGGADWILVTALGLYAVAAFFRARWQFLHMQDTAWTGGVIAFGGRRAAMEQSSLRERKPAALLWKEVQLQQVTLLGMVCLLVLHLGVVVLRKAGAHVFGTATLAVLQVFGLFWFIVPMVAGSLSVAEERQLGTLDGLLCLPVSRRVQFVIKLLLVLVLGLLSAMALCMVEYVGSNMGAGMDFGVKAIPYVVFGFLATSLLGFYASTLTRGMVPALAAGTVVSIVFWILKKNAPIFSVDLFTALLTLTAAVIWLAYGNFCYVFESSRRWRQNIVGLITLLAVIGGLSAAIYYRVWELVVPLESPHGPARLPAGKPVFLGRYDYGTLEVVLSDGRLWENRVTQQAGWPDADDNHFVPGSNWVAAFAQERETVGIRSDGTLWVSEKPGRPWIKDGMPPLVQFGSETDWQSMVFDPPPSSVILLKKNGTLWRWGTNFVNYKHYQGLRAFTPHQLGADSDWVRILRGNPWIYAWKRNGSAWVLHEIESDEDKIRSQMELKLDMETTAERAPGLDHVQFQSLNLHPTYNNSEVGVREDGTLWYWDWERHLEERRHWGLRPTSKVAWPTLVQIGKNSNWAEVTSAYYQLVALKADGSIWKWNFNPKMQTMDRTLQEAPVRMGMHNDWVGLGGWQNETITLSADGTLWRWEKNDLPKSVFHETGQLLAPSRRPAKIENIFGAPE